MEFAQRFACGDRTCPGSRFLPEHPEHGRLTVRCACAACERITTHRAVGRVGGTIRGAV